MTADLSLELHRLLSALCDGELSSEQHARLEHLLSSDEECRQRYLEYMDLHAQLLAHLPLTLAADTDVEMPAMPIRPAAAELVPPRPIRISQPLRYAIVAAVTLAASLLLQLYWMNPAPPVSSHVRSVAIAPAEPHAASYVATLAHAIDCVWDGAPSWRVGSRLVSGELRLSAGVARIRFDSGPELVVEGPAILRLESSAAATVLQGRVVFRGSETAAPFKLKTPTATLVDLGTEYAILVGPQGEDVYVLDGEVERTPSSGQSAPEHLAAGEGRRYAGTSDSVGQPAEFRPQEFQRLLANADPLPINSTAGLLAYEGFDYQDSLHLPNGTASGGTGWSSPWRPGFARPRNEGDQSVLALNVTEGLSRPGALEPAIGGSFDYTGFTKYFRRLNAPLRMDADNVYYLSFLFRRDGPPEETLNSSAILLRTDEELELEHAGQENRRDRLNIGIDRVNHLFTQLHGIGARVPLPLSYGETYLLVAKIVASASNPDQVFIRVYAPDEPVEHEETGRWTIEGPPFRSNLVFDWFELHINSCSRKTLDEARLGITWSSVAAPWMVATTGEGSK